MTARLMVITPVYPPAVGGIETLTEGIVCRWDGPVEVVTLAEAGSAEWDARAGYAVRRAPNKPRGGRRAILNLTCLAPFRARAFRPDVVLSMHIRCGRAAQLSRAVSGARWVQYYHAKEIPTWPEASGLCLARADHHIAVSRYTASLARAVRVPRNALSVIPPGVDAGEGPPRRERRRPTILTISRMDDSYKGHDVMLAALVHVKAAIPNVRWVVVGDGRLLEMLRHKAQVLSLAGNVEFRGAVDDRTRDECLLSSDVFALPSRVAEDGCTGEGFGIVYVEAAAAGLPVVAGNQGGVVDAVRHGTSGLLVDPTDARHLSRALLQLLTDEAMRNRMSAAARQWSKNFTWSAVMPRIHDAVLGDLDGSEGVSPAPEARS